MHMSYIHEEVILERTATKRENEAVWEKESVFFKRFQEYYEVIQQATNEFNYDETFADISLGCCKLETVGGSHIDFSKCGSLRWKAHFTEHSWDVVTAADAMQSLALQDNTHCMTLRVIVEDEDPAERPVVISKSKEDTVLLRGEAVWQKATPVTQTLETWGGDLTCSLFLPNTDVIPAAIVDAYHSVEKDYCHDKYCEELLENQVEEYEGNMEGGGFESFSITGSQLANFLSRMQQLSDLAAAAGGSWQVEGYQYSDDCSVLCFETDKQGKIEARYLKP